MTKINYNLLVIASNSEAIPSLNNHLSERYPQISESREDFNFIGILNTVKHKK